MATSGRAAAAAAVAVLLAAVAGCATAPQPSSSAGSPSTTPAASGDVTHGPVGVKVAATPASWQRAIAAGTLPRGQNEHLNVVSVSPDGVLIFAESQIDDRPPTLLMIRQPTGRRTVIQSLGHDTRLLGVAYDGRYLTYTEALTNNADKWVLWVWDSQGGDAPHEISRNALDATGLAIPGPTNRPLIDRGRVFWVQGDQDGTDNLRMYTISSRTSRLIRRGHPGTPFAMGRLLIWPEMRSPGALTALSAISLDTLRPSRLPAALAKVAGPTSIDADAATVAWVDASMTELYVWRTSWTAPRLGVRSPTGNPLTHVQVSGPLVTWDDTEAGWVLDGRTMAYTHLVPGAGNAAACGSYLAVASTPVGDNAASIARESVVNTATLPPL